MRVAGGLLFELTGHSIGDPTRDEEDVPVVFRSWQSQNYLITSMHVKGVLPNLNVLGVLEVQVHPLNFSISMRYVLMYSYLVPSVGISSAINSL